MDIAFCKSATPFVYRCSCNHPDDLIGKTLDRKRIGRDSAKRWVAPSEKLLELLPLVMLTVDFGQSAAPQRLWQKISPTKWMQKQFNLTVKSV